MTELIELTAVRRPSAVAGAPLALRRPREDALPEALITEGRYRDEGCDLFTSCLTCPLPRCRYDVPGGARTLLNRVRDEEIRQLRLELGLPVDEIARRYRVSRRTVFRVLHGAKACPETREAMKDERNGART